ncbi:hypothetical protein IG631_18970 [Alternaria alternata]|nr:hypothetical protein IG631_18970 [Alternaria alternata]
MYYILDPVVLSVMRSQINSSDELLVDDLSLAIRTQKDVLNQAGIIVKTRDMGEVNIPINDVTTVEQLKSRIEREMGVPESVQRIVFCGKQLEDGKSLRFEKKVIMLTYFQRHYSEQQWYCRGNVSQIQHLRSHIS